MILLICDTGNQKLPESILEDRINKPWRPLPTGRLSSLEARRLQFFLIPIGILVVHLCMGHALQPFVGVLILTWMYNDLGGSEDHYIIRNLCNAAAFVCFSTGSTLVASGNDARLTRHGQNWVCMIGLIVVTTIQMQDLPDIDGDAVRGRETMPLTAGDTFARWSVAVPVLCWSFIGPIFWHLPLLAYSPTVFIGGLLSFRVLAYRQIIADQKTWKLWCLWIISIYLLPLMGGLTGF
ncbi:UbiA prenyltransferase [Phlyctema vagabunda]|uniref:UbiA prenyltransferase n=1 Tax=Phlyctema vagabunda TaxID=108571 RepID=A0ABR4P8J6_9HELO